MNREDILNNAKSITFKNDSIPFILNGQKTSKLQLLNNKQLTTKKPPYNIGDILYVREIWQKVFETEYDSNAKDLYINIRTIIKNFDNIPKTEAGLSREDSCALMEPRMKYYVYKASDIKFADERGGLIWRSSICMPKEAARIFLRVNNIKLQQLQYVREEYIANEVLCFTRPASINEINKTFKEQWNNSIKEINKNINSWEANPWVWVIEFEKINVDN